jgi:DNA-directed RNA polymerase subunit RPC12/RpoP
MVIHDYLTTVSCDKCSREFQIERNLRENTMRRAAAKRGWRVINGEDICPDCLNELRTCYCPICDKHFEVRSNDSMGNCPDCGHHVVLHREGEDDV